MKKHDRSYRSLDTEIHLETDSEEALNYLENTRILENHIPEIERSEPEDPDFRITYSSQEEPSFRYSREKSEIFISGEFDRDIFRHDLSFMMLPVFARLHSEKGREMIHSSSVQGENSGLIVGSRGAGKSICVTELCYKGNSILSAEQTLVNRENRIVGGTKTISNRAACIDKYFDDIEYQKEPGKNPYEQKVIRTPEELSFQEGREGDIAAIYFIDIEDTYDLEVSKRELSEYKTELLQNINNTVRATERTIMNFSKPLPSFDSYLLAEKRLEHIDYLLRESKVMDVKGNLEDVSRYINQELKG